MSQAYYRLSDALAIATQEHDWPEVKIGILLGDVVVCCYVDGTEYERHMGWSYGYLLAATDAELQADIQAALDDLKAFIAERA